MNNLNNKKYVGCKPNYFFNLRTRAPWAYHVFSFYIYLHYFAGLCT